MSAVVAWCGFLGAWLLFAGPVYQASLELREQDAVTDEVQQAMQVVAAPPPVSAWWWRLPPVRLVLESRRWKGRREAMMTTLTAAQRKKVVQYLNKTTGWLFVAFGGFLIAVKETWELSERYEWPIWVFAVLVVVGGIAVPVLSTVVTRVVVRRMGASGQ